MLKKTIRRLGALAMVLAMAVSVFAVNASAADDSGSSSSPATQMTITKKVNIKQNVYAPNTEFEFTVADGKTGLKYDKYDVIQGKAGDWTVGGKVTVTKTDLTDTVATGSTTMTLNKTYTEPGIYSYVVKETAGSYDGMEYDTTEKNVLVFVVYKDGKYVVDKAVVVNVTDSVATAPATADAKSDLTFTNKYNDDSKNGGTHDLTFTKKVTGKLGNRSKEFEFNITITANEAGQKTGEGESEQYYVVINNKDGNTAKTIKSGELLKVKLRDSDTVKIYGLSPKDTYTVTETEAGQDGYTTSGEVKNATTMGSADQTVTVENEKDTTTPGGVIMTIAPYALMLVVAGAFAVVFLSRRNRAE